MKKILILTIILSKIFTQSQPVVPAIELIIKVVNSNPGVSRAFTATSVNGIIWDNVNPNRFYIVNNPLDYNNQSVVIPNGNHSGDNIGYDNNGDAEGQYPQLRLSDYEISVTGSNETVIIEWQGCFSGATGDVTVIYDAQVNSFSLDNPPTPMGEDCLQPTDPYGLEVIKLEQHPLLIWWVSAYPYNSNNYNIYRKVNNGNWELIKANQPSPPFIDEEVIFSKPYSDSYSYKVFGVSGDGTKESDNTTNVVSIMGNGISNKFQFHINEYFPSDFSFVNPFPNPFNPETTIKYDLPEQSKVHLTIFDLLGRKINTLKNNTEDAGFYSIKWNGTDENGKPLSSGMYIVNISAQSLEREEMFTQSQKVVLMK